MWYHSILSGAMLMVPVAITLGIYISIEWQKVIHYPVYPKVSHDGGVSTPIGPGITTTQYCQKLLGITPYPGKYVYNPNQWGDPTNSGALCLNITTDGGVNAKSFDAPAFSATWGYPQATGDNPVHAYPNAKINNQNLLPMTVSNISSIPIDMSWSYSVGNDNVSTTDSAALDAINLNANVAIDMFLATDKAKSESTTESMYEVMVWFGRYGPSTQPIGWDVGVKKVENVNGTNFNLFYGSNAVGQKVFTWVAERNITRFVGDVSPLLTSLSAFSGPVAADNLGYVAFGTEALWSGKNVTFACDRLRMTVVPGSS